MNQRQIGFDPMILERRLPELGLQVEHLNEMQQLSFEAACKRWAELQAIVKRNFKRLALELHPDRTGGDKAKTEQFIELTKAAEFIASVKLAPPVRPPPVRVVYNVVHYGYSNSTTSTSGGWW